MGLSLKPFPPAKISWKHWSRVFTNPRLWDGPIREIIERNELPAGKPGQTFPGTCAVFQVTPRPPARPCLVKIFPPQCRTDALREAYCLRNLNRAGLPIPSLMASGHVRPGWPYLVLGMLPGKAVRESCRSGLHPFNPSFRRLGKLVRRIHKAGPPKTRTGWESWASFYERRGRKLKRDPLLSRFAKAFLPALRHVQPVLLHADITEDHVLLKKCRNKWRLPGLIDFGDARMGPIEYEWPALWFGACARKPELFRAFLAGYGKSRPPNWRIRAMSATLLHTFVSRDITKLAMTTKRGLSRLEPMELLNLLWPPQTP